MQQALKRVESAVSGDTAMGQEGVVVRLSRIEGKVDLHEKKFLQMATAGVVLLGAAQFLQWLLKH
jgi:hypothetical protein